MRVVVEVLSRDSDKPKISIREVASEAAARRLPGIVLAETEGAWKVNVFLTADAAVSRKVFACAERFDQ